MSEANKHAVSLTTNVCPHGTRNLQLDYGSTSEIVAGPKCCGRWTVEHEFALTESLIDELVIAVENAKEWMPK